MSEEQYDDKTRRTRPADPGDAPPPQPGSGEIPRRGYDRHRDPTLAQGQPAPPPPPIYDDPPPRYGPRPGAPPPPRRGPGRERLPRDSGLYLPWWSLVVLIVFVGAATVGLLLVVLNLGGATNMSLTPQFVVITGEVQPTQAGQNNPGLPTGIPSPQPSSMPILPTLGPTQTPLPGGCLLNAEVYVFGTGAVGLNLREDPRLASEVQFVAREGDKLMVLDGPQFVDDYEWCKVENLSRPGQFGWGVIDFMIAADAYESGQ